MSRVGHSCIGLPPALSKGRLFVDASSMRATRSEAAALKKLPIAVVGDSIAAQVAQALSEHLGHHRVHVFSVPLHTIPIQEDSLREYLHEHLGSATIAILAFGSWYHHEENINWQDQVLGANTTLELLKNCERNIGLHAPSLLTEERELYPSLMNKLALSRNLRWCPQALGYRSFASDLQRLLEVFSRVRISSTSKYPNSRFRNWPIVMWKDVPPQHFACEDSGLFSSGCISESRTNNSFTCGPISDIAKSSERNAAADRVIHEFNKKQMIDGKAVVVASSVHTWSEDAIHWELHNAMVTGRGKDCTHFCSHSVVTLNWAVAITAAAASLIQRRSRKLAPGPAPDKFAGNYSIEIH